MKSIVLMTEAGKASFLPAIALLVVGLVGLQHLGLRDARLFLLVLFAMLLLVLLGEYLLQYLRQRALQNACTQLIKSCQNYLGGKPDERVTLPTSSALFPLVPVINNLLDTLSKNKEKQESQQAASHLLEQEHSSLQVQFQRAQSHNQLVTTSLQQVIRAVSPVFQGALWVRAELPPGEVGVLADICNALIEEVSRFVQWTRACSTHLRARSQTLLTSSVALADTVEAQLLSFSQTTDVTEHLTVFLQHLHGTLQLTVERLSEIQAHLYQQLHVPSAPLDWLYELKGESEYTIHLLEELLTLTQTHMIQAETMMADLYMVAARLHHASHGVLHSAEQIAALATLAEEWDQQVKSFQLAEPEQAPPAHRPTPEGPQRNWALANQPTNPHPSQDAGKGQALAHVL